MSTPDAEERLMELLLRWDELRTQGQDPSVEELCTGCPELALRFPTGSVCCSLSSLRATARRTAPAMGQILSRGMATGASDLVGDSQIAISPTARHAKGGLGEVFVARDEELNREVALKEIQLQFSQDPVSRSRFLSEAEITGSLEHPGIVPVYGLGRHDDGRPFYAMRFIKGNTLKEAIDEFHNVSLVDRDPGARTLGLRALLRRLIDVCNAIAYAHNRGVLHRDLKPSNVMLGPYGETLVVDWGLAKCFDRLDARVKTPSLPSIRRWREKSRPPRPEQFLELRRS